MKEIKILIIYLASIMSYCAYAQVHTKGVPISFGSQFRIGDDNVNTYKVGTRSAKEIEAKLKEVKKCKDCNGDYYGIGLDFELDIKKQVAYEKIGNKKLWRASLHLDSAKGAQLYFGEFHLPKGASLFIYNEERTMILGSFSYLNNNKSHTFFTQVIEGENLYVEYSEENAIDASNSKLKITKVIQVFTDFFGGISQLNAVGDYIGASNLCNVDVNCIEGLPYASEKKAIGIMTSYDWNLNLTAFCTGALVNTTSTARKPYFLTAKHCFSPDISYGAFPSEWVIYFNFESSYCGQSATEAKLWANTTNSVSGAQIVSMGHATDYLLLQLNDDPSFWYDVMYLGWDRTSVANTGGLVGIHHPFRDLKKISISNGTPSKVSVSIDPNSTSVPEVTSVPGFDFTHWRLNYDVGTVQEGSSGSPLITKNSRKIIGVLTSSATVCLINNKSCRAYYGALNQAWYKPDAGYPTLANVLDPSQTGFMSFGSDVYIAGSIPTCTDGKQNGTETGIDCGGNCKLCTATPTCFDYIKNGTETGIDCGGSCPPCAVPSCTDGIKNQTETGIDCGGTCVPCSTLCNNGKLDGNELEKDCGGSCTPCPDYATNGTFDVDQVCMTANGYPKAPDLVSIPLYKERVNCSLGPWKSSHGWGPSIYTDPSVFNMTSDANFYTPPILGMHVTSGKVFYGSGARVWESCGVFSDLTDYLDPDYSYTLYFSFSNLQGRTNGDLHKNFGIDYFDIYAASGLQHSNTPVFTGPPDAWGYPQMVTNDLPQFRPPTYPINKLSILGKGLLQENFWTLDKPDGSWSKAKVDFTVDQYNVYKQLWIRADLTRIPPSGQNGIYEGWMGFDNIKLTKRPRCTGNVTVTSTTAKSIQSYNYITTSGTVVIPSGSPYSYKAAQYVDLNQDFETSANAEFVAEIYDCYTGTTSNLRQSSELEILEVSEPFDTEIQTERLYTPISMQQGAREATNANYGFSAILVPNPANSKVSLVLQSELNATATIQIEDVTGAESRSETRNVDIISGKNSIDLDISHLKAGIYLCVLTVQDKREILRLVIVK